jgi:hypothetical protein
VNGPIRVKTVRIPTPLHIMASLDDGAYVKTWLDQDRSILDDHNSRYMLIACLMQKVSLFGPDELLQSFNICMDKALACKILPSMQYLWAHLILTHITCYQRDASISRRVGIVIAKLLANALELELTSVMVDRTNFRQLGPRMNTGMDPWINIRVKMRGSEIEIFSWIPGVHFLVRHIEGQSVTMRTFFKLFNFENNDELLELMKSLEWNMERTPAAKDSQLPASNDIDRERQQDENDRIGALSSPSSEAVQQSDAQDLIPSQTPAPKSLSIDWFVHNMGRLPIVVATLGMYSTHSPACFLLSPQLISSTDVLQGVFLAFIVVWF